jgi:predicted site-specific integrase-resolvase
MDEEDNLTLGQIAEKYNVCRDTILKWAKNGIISYTKLPSGIRRYHYRPKIFDAEPKPPSEEPERVGIIYARVSSSKQTDDLQNQIKLLRQSYPDHELYSDVGSGLNYKRKNLRKMVRLVLKEQVSEIVVAYRDRLSRFSFEFFQWLFGLFGAKIVVLAEPVCSPEKEMVDDLLAVLTVFSARANGLRKYKNKIKSDPDLSYPNPKVHFEATVGDGKDDLQSDGSGKQEE